MRPSYPSSPSFSNPNPSFGSFISFLFHNFTAEEEEQGRLPKYPNKRSFYVSPPVRVCYCPVSTIEILEIAMIAFSFISMELESSRRMSTGTIPCARVIIKFLSSASRSLNKESIVELFEFAVPICNRVIRFLDSALTAFLFDEGELEPGTPPSWRTPLLIKIS